MIKTILISIMSALAVFFFINAQAKPAKYSVCVYNYSTIPYNAFSLSLGKYGVLHSLNKSDNSYCFNDLKASGEVYISVSQKNQQAYTIPFNFNKENGNYAYIAVINNQAVITYANKSSVPFKPQ